MNANFQFVALDCPVCNSSKQKFLGYRGGKFHRHHRGLESTIVQCEECRLLFPNPFPFPKNSASLYSDPNEYFKGQQEETRRKIFRKMLLSCLKLYKGDRTSLRHLDVGCGNGLLMQVASELGFVTEGIDFSKGMADFVKQRYGLPVHVGTLDSFRPVEKSCYEIISLSAVLEHTAQPRLLLEHAARLLTPEGLLHIEVPVEPTFVTWLAGAVFKLSGKRQIFYLSPTWNPYHVLGFSKATLCRLLSDYDFSVAKYERFGDANWTKGKKLTDRLLSTMGSSLEQVTTSLGLGRNQLLLARRNSFL